MSGQSTADASPSPHPAPQALLEVEGLTTVFRQGEREIEVVRQVDFVVNAGETLALVGESGSGKSVTALSLLRLVPPPGRVSGGIVRWRGRDLTELGESALHRLRGREIGLVPQDPATALNPVFTVGEQIIETLTTHGVARSREARQRMLELLDVVGVPDPAQRAGEHPYQLSGGLRQRVMIALGLAAEPALLIADEPTTGLDATTQSRIVELLRGLPQRQGCALLLISHDLGVVGACADRVAVMYAGQIVEQGPSGDLLERPQHPYTQGLLASVPGDAPGEPLPGIAGMAPRPGEVPTGCGFGPRCPQRFGDCDSRPPAVWPLGASAVRCHLLDPAAGAAARQGVG